MRIAVAHIEQETNSFTPTRTTIETFRSFGLYEGVDLWRVRGVGALGGFLAEVGQVPGTTVAPLLYASAVASGPLTDPTLRFLERRLVSNLERALPVDGLYLSLHGAAVAESEPDVEGHLLAAVRSILGPSIPIVASLDHHGNVTRRMIASLDGLVADRTQPHQPSETGRLAARQLVAILRDDVKPTIAWRKIPMLTHQEQYSTSRGPMKQWFDAARDYEAIAGVMSVSPFPMQPWLDVPEGGWATVVVTDDDMALAERIAIEHARMAWQARARFWAVGSLPVEEAVRTAAATRSGLVLLSDIGDSVFGGAPGDSVHILRELLRQEVTEMALVPVVDPDVVQHAVSAGVGSIISIELGGRLAPAFHRPVAVTAAVAGIRSGPLEAEVIGLASFDMGRTVLLEAGPIRIVVSERAGIGGNHPIVYRSLGVEPASARMVVMKTASNFQYYAGMTPAIIPVDTPGPTTSHLEEFDWQHLPRPIYPLDAAVTF